MRGREGQEGEERTGKKEGSEEGRKEQRGIEER